MGVQAGDTAAGPVWLRHTKGWAAARSRWLLLNRQNTPAYSGSWPPEGAAGGLPRDDLFEMEGLI